MNLPLLLLILGVSHKENQQWEDFKLTYKKTYDTVQEEAYRRAIFLKNIKEIESHNQKYEQGLESFSKGLNEFSDMESDEFKDKLLMNEDNTVFDPKFEVDDALSLLEEEATRLKVEQKWNEFKMTHNKQYSSLEEEMRRQEIFQYNVEVIEKHNERYYQGLETFYMGINQFTDLTSQEFKDTYLTHQPLNATIYDTVEESFRDADELDQEPLTAKSYYYTKSIKIKNQGSCGSCWAFATTGVLEYAYYLFKNRKVVSLSEQELVDCERQSHGCQGGIPYYAMKWVHQHGINFENEYPYSPHQGSCRQKHRNVQPNIIKSVGFTGQNERDMLSKLQSVGPIQVAVCADHWQHYSGGVFEPNRCNGRMSNHAVVAIGAVNDKGKNVWILRNSWGTHWGHAGHAKVLMFRNACNIAQQSAAYITH